LTKKRVDHVRQSAIGIGAQESKIGQHAIKELFVARGRLGPVAVTQGVVPLPQEAAGLFQHGTHTHRRVQKLLTTVRWTGHWYETASGEI